MSAEGPTDEDAARAGVYALLARLFYAAPDADLLASLAAREHTSGAPESAFTRALSALGEAARAAEPAACADEFEALFGGAGKALVTPYASGYLSGSAPHAPLVSLRNLLAAHGLQRLQRAHEPEDHFAALFDAMRHLVLQSDVAAQEEFFERYLNPAVRPFCSAVKHYEHVSFYRPVADLTVAFAEIEHEAFQMN